jgi:hypothetical protein
MPLPEGTIWVQAVAKANGFDFTLWAVGLVRTGELRVGSATDLVNQVQRRAAQEGAKLAGLSLFAHGGNGSFTIGDDNFGGIQPPSQKPVPRLAPLKSLFAEGGALCLCVCEAGRSEGLLIDLAQTVGVRVYGCTGGVSPNLGTTQLGWWDGVVVAASPDGSVERNASLP